MMNKTNTDTQLYSRKIVSPERDQYNYSILTLFKIMSENKYRKISVYWLDIALYIYIYYALRNDGMYIEPWTVITTQ